MSTSWQTPNNIIQYAEDPSHIEWNNNFQSLTSTMGGVSLSQPLLHIARQPRNDILMKSWYLKATGFSFEDLPGVINGVKFRFSVRRGGRVFDDTVQLTVNDNLIGENRCQNTVDPVQVYGGTTDLWGVPDLTSIVSDPSFGIVIRLKSHPAWPHKTTPILNGLELQIY